MKRLTLTLVTGTLALAAALAGCKKDDERITVDGLVNTPNIPTGPSGTFLQVGNMVEARAHHRVCLLSSGDVLVAGGENAAGAALSTVEFYDYDQGNFLSAPFPMVEARVRFTLTLIAGNDAVLLTGGVNGTGTLSSAEVFKPSAYTFTATAGAMAAARSHHAAVLLPNSNVFLCGGLDATGNALASCELYDFANDVFLPVTTGMATARARHTATLLNNGKILIAGGVDSAGNVLTSAEIYDPGTLGVGEQGSFAATGALPAGRADHEAVKINLGIYAGQVALLGGFGASVSTPTILNSAAVFDPAAAAQAGDCFTLASVMSAGRDGHRAVMLTGGMKLLITGGNVLNAPDVLDPYANGLGTGMANDAVFQRTQDASSNPTQMTAVTTGRSRHGASWLLNGTVLLCGGLDGGAATNSAEIWNP